METGERSYKELVERLDFLEHNNEVFNQMLDIIFEPYERMWFSQEDLGQKDRDILEAVGKAHTMLGRLRKEGATT